MSALQNKTLCFTTMCKNEEHCIKSALESVAPYIDYWVVCDTGSTDKTCEIVTSFFKEKGIPGELFVDEWKGFDHNKSLMYERVYNKTDYVLHFDADDFLVGNFDKAALNNETADQLYVNCKRGLSMFKCTIIYNNRLRWKIAGVAHNVIVCLDKRGQGSTQSSTFVKDDLWIDNNERGARMFDPEKYIKDAMRLKDQFFETLYDDPYNLNYRSVFYTAQSYYDSKHHKEAIQWYRLYTRLKDTWSEELFESHLRIAKCMEILKFPLGQIIAETEKAIKIFPDRAEPFFFLGKYCNGISKQESGYTYLKMAQSMDLESVNEKYKLFVNQYCYGKHVNDELSVSCYWTNRAEEGYKLLLEILHDDDPYFQPHQDRLLDNKMHFERKYPLLVKSIESV